MKNKYLSYLFTSLAILLSNVMCATVAYNYCCKQYEILYAGYIAPAIVAFLFGLPYAIGIISCAILACFFHKRYRNSGK